MTGNALASNNQQLDEITLENVPITFKNFSGKEGPYNAKGKRNFSALITDEQAQILGAQGLNIKHLRPRDEQEPPQAHIKINVNFESFKPPKIYMVTSQGKERIDADMAPILDWADIIHCDLTFNFYRRPQEGGRMTVTAYLQTLVAVVKEDELEQKWASVPTLGERLPDSAQNVLQWQESNNPTLEITEG